VGNLVVGGSGKTPVVAAIARMLQERGDRPAVLSRGYGRRQVADGVVVVSDGSNVLATVEQSGDEPYMLARMLPGVPVLVSADRYLAGTLAEQRFGASVHLLDDGFQHLQLARDVDVLMMAAADLNEQVLPSGRLREPIAAAHAADVVLVNGSDDDVQAVGRVVWKPPVLSDLGQTLLEPPIFRVVTEFAAPRFIAPDVAGSRHARVVAVAGIARPQRFFDALPALGHEVVREFTFRDHHWFSKRDIETIERAKADSRADFIITTEKDAVRISGPLSWAYLPMTVRIEPQPTFQAWLESRLSGRREAVA
jgi:tetraacyldisaccharide 4'-kinase